MKNYALLPSEITNVCEDMLRLFDVKRMVVFGIKNDEKCKGVCDFDLCVVADSIDDKNIWLKKAYLEIDSDIPFDLFLYTEKEWDDCIKFSESFASRINRKGSVVYEKD